MVLYGSNLGDANAPLDDEPADPLRRSGFRRPAPRLRRDATTHCQPFRVDAPADGIEAAGFALDGHEQP